MTSPLAEPVPCATIEQVLARPEARIVDLRSPAEFADDHLPGAVNVPLFDNAQRALVGTLYARSSPDEALREGVSIVEGKVEALVGAVGEAAGWDAPTVDLGARVQRRAAGGIEAMDARLAPEDLDELPERPVVLHCWRGGLRSRSVVALVRELGLDRAVGLRGGYKAYRSRVLAELDGWSAPPAFVLRGLTGVGKTLVLRELERQRPGWTLDLELCAGHRSSILGMVGLEPCSQKTFESRIAARVRRGFPGPVVFEGESRKVGDAIVPAKVWEALSGGGSIHLVASLERRVQVLLDDYLERESNREHLRRQLPFIERRLGARRWEGVLTGLLDGGREAELVETLLEHYYDPLYRHSERDHVYATEIDTGDPRRAAAEIAAWIESRLVDRA